MGCEEKQFAFAILIYRRGKETAKKENRAGSLFFEALTFVNVLA